MRNSITRYKPYLIFLLVFSISFFLVKTLFVYLLPFIIGLFISFLMYPIYRFMKKRLSFKPAFSATVISLFIFSIVIAIALFIVYLLVSETIKLYENNRIFIDKYISEFDLSSILTEFNLDGDFFTKISDTAFGIVKIIPIFLTLIIISFVSTICFINNLPYIKNAIRNKLSDKNAENFDVIIYKAKEISRKFIKSYLLLYGLTFVESIFIFSLIDLDYVVVFAFLAAVSDLLPILGPGAVYFPIAIFCALSGNFLSCITLLIFWVITVIIRQILEPKLLSDNIKIHPLIVLSALYFSIVSSNIWVLFYILTLTVVYKIMAEAKILKPVFLNSERVNK